jgi:hypothetical protein
VYIYVKAGTSARSITKLGLACAIREALGERALTSEKLWVKYALKDSTRYKSLGYSVSLRKIWVTARANSLRKIWATTRANSLRKIWVTARANG